MGQQMGQQAAGLSASSWNPCLLRGKAASSSFFNPCIARAKPKEPEDDHERLVLCLRRAEALILDPEKLQRECEYHFNRAGLDAHGDMRRVELRRLLWTFARSLGSVELTWEGLEATAVIGTLEPHVPVVTHDEFFRCVLKTVHLVVAELRRKMAEADAQRRLQQEQLQRQQEEEAASRARPKNPWAALAEKHGGRRAISASSCSSSCSSAMSGSGSAAQSSSSRGASTPRGSEAAAPRPRRGGRGAAAEAGRLGGELPPGARTRVEVPFPKASSAGGPINGKGRGKGRGGKAAPSPATPPSPPQEAPIAHEALLPLDDVAVVHGMTALLLSNDGNFEPQHLSVAQGSLMLCDPDEAEPTLAQRLMGSDRRDAFDLSLLESADTGEDVLRTPLAALLPGSALESGEALDRMLVLGFEGGEALCLWLNSVEDCQRCLRAVTAEAGLLPELGPCADPEGG